MFPIDKQKLELWKEELAIKPYIFCKQLLWIICGLLFLFAFLMNNPVEIFHGMIAIVNCRSGLIADYFTIGNIGATFFNAAAVMAICLLLFEVTKIRITGPGIASVLLCAGFAMFGKNILNIWPIIAGVWLYAKHEKDHFGKYIYNALYGTALAPLVTEIALIRGDWISLLAAIAAGLVIGFLLPPLSTYTLRIHQGYSLYNVGFSAGLIGTLLVSILRSFDYRPESQLIWTYENNPYVIGFVLLIFVSLLLLGLWLCDWKLKPSLRLFRHSGRLMSDFVLMDGIPPVLVNMGTLVILSVAFLLLTGGNINGATLGGIFTIVAFGAFGKHLKNVTPVILGVFLGSLFKVWNIHDPSVQLAALFGTCLAPIAGQYGWKYGVLAGLLHSSMVLSIGSYHGGLNLYNNGFSAGLVALILIPLIESLEGGKLNASR